MKRLPNVSSLPTYLMLLCSPSFGCQCQLALFQPPVKIVFVKLSGGEDCCIPGRSGHVHETDRHIGLYLMKD